MMFWTYFQFLSINVLKKWTTWVFGALFLFVISMLLIVVPFAAGISPWSMWGSPIMSPTIMMMYVAALYSAINSIAIFKDYRDDGTELILSSKPLSRSKMALAKFALYILSSLLISISTILISLMTLCVPQVTVNETTSLMLSLFVSSFLIMVIMGMIATIISLFANKIWTVLANIALIIVIEIISIVNVFAIKTPSDLAKNDGHTVVSVNYLSQDGKNDSFGALTPNINTTDGLNLDFLTLQEEQAEWSKYANRSLGNVANVFDFMGQFTILNNFGVLHSLANENASKYFGGNRFYNYTLNNKHIWASNNQPLFYVQLPAVPIELTKDSFDLLADMSSFINKIVRSLSDQSMVAIGKMNASTLSIQNLISNIYQNQFAVAWCYDGWVGSPLGKKWLTYNQLYPSLEQAKIFEKIINKFIDYSNDDLDDDRIYNFGTQLRQVFRNDDDPPTENVTLSGYALKNTFGPDQESKDFIKDLIGSDMDLGATNNFRNLLHYIFVSENKGTLDILGTGRTPNIFWEGIKDESGLMSTIASFKLYAFESLTKDLYDTISLSSNTPLNIIIPNTTQAQQNINLAASPILPLLRGDSGYINKDLDSILPDELKPLSALIDFIALLQSYYPNVKDITLNGESLIPEDLKSLVEDIVNLLKWNNPSNDNNEFNNYFAGRKIMRERSLLNEVISENKYGYLNARDPNDFTLDQAYVINLNTVSVPSFPLLYNNLGAQFKASSNFTPWAISLGWAMFALLLCGCTYLIYSRTDFK